MQLEKLWRQASNRRVVSLLKLGRLTNGTCNPTDRKSKIAMEEYIEASAEAEGLADLVLRRQ